MANPEKPKDHHEFLDFFDPMIGACIDAVNDIRHSLIEEPWFGKEISGDIEMPDYMRKSEGDILSEFYGWPTDEQYDDVSRIGPEILVTFGIDSLSPTLENEERDRPLAIEAPDHGIDI